MPHVQKEIDRFAGFLQQQGLKLTGERSALVREIFSTHYHFEADELLFKMKEKSVKISRATVYRTLELLVKSGMVRRVHLGEDHYHYEHVTGDSHHDHLICTTCGAVTEFHDETLEQPPSPIPETPAGTGWAPPATGASSDESARASAPGACGRA